MDDETRPGAGPGTPTMPEYRGEPLDADRGPGLGCFWFQLILIVVFFVLTPFGVLNGWPDWLNAVLLLVTLGLLLFAGQTAIFLLRLVAADRRTRRRPLRSATPTVGEIEDTHEPAEAPEVGEIEATHVGVIAKVDVTASPERAEIHRILLEAWDPIGVWVGEPGPADDEYDGYIPEIEATLGAGGTEEDVAGVLDRIRSQQMGGGHAPAVDRMIAARIVRAWGSGPESAPPVVRQ